MNLKYENGKLNYDPHDITNMTDLERINLVVALQDLAHEVRNMVDEASAEGQLHREITRRMNNLASSAMAAGQMSQMWSDQNNRFYKQRRAIQQGGHT